ncbi:MAG: hypothetical protein GXP29_15600 [Planctomycetes bacterium]|nr:hypothetical protein [Planctomycetota bacterium]
MSRVRKTVRVIAWAFGAVFGFAVIAYVVLFIANLEDRPPSMEITALEAMQGLASPVVTEGNSYLYMLGFSGHPDVDPMTLGRERYDWMEAARPEFRTEDDPLEDDYDYRLKRADDIANLSKTCSESEAECLNLLESGNGVVERWLRAEKWLFDRYIVLTSMTEFREAIPFELLAPLPSYSVMFEGQRLMFADAWRSASAGDAGAVSKALERDLVYWRMVLENSDALITKMIGTAAIIRHFKLGNLVLRRLPDDSKSAGIPPSWRTEITDAERSMGRSLAGEWTYFDVSTKKVVADNENPFGGWTGINDSTTLDRATWTVLKPFWQHQELSNRHARLMLDLGNAFDVPYDEVPAAVEVADQLQESAYRPFSRLYNFTGDLVMSANYWTFSDYAVRVSDLEGIRRAALLVAELRSDGVSKDDVVQLTLVSEIVDPYTNEPFTWNDGSDVIVFYGLEPHDRSQHELIY